MTRKEAERLNHLEAVLLRNGFSTDEFNTLRRISATLHRWSEHECNGAIQRDEETNVPYWYSTMTGKRLYRAPDRETGALRRLFKIMDSHPDHAAYYQGDPRGCSLYIVPRSMLSKHAAGNVTSAQMDLESCYSNGIAVY